MPTWLKVVLAVVGLGVAGLVALGVGGYLWLQKNKGALAETGKKAVDEGRAFGHGQAAPACIQQALRQNDTDPGFVREVAHGLFLRACLAAAAEGSLDCTKVPRRDQLMASATWAVAECAALGRTNDQACGRLMQRVQEHCHDGPLGEFPSPSKTP